MKTFATKLAMTQIYNDRGEQKAVTILNLLGSVLIGKKTVEKDGYESDIFALVKEDTVGRKSVVGQFKKFPNIVKIKESKSGTEESLSVGSPISAKDFTVGDKLTIYAVTKGKGFAGTVKRHGFATGPKTHGSDNYRQPGSIGPTYPQRTILGRRMGGHMGAKNIKLKNVEVVRIEAEKGRIWVKGSIPGANKAQLILEK